MTLTLTDNAVTVLERRYLKKNAVGEIIEKPDDMFKRVAENIAEAEKNYGGDPKEVAKKFYKMITDLDFMPNSPCLMNAGRELQQLSACFVLPIEDSIEGIFNAIKWGAQVHKSGGGTGYSFSRLRPRGDRVKSTMGVSSGPVSFMKAFDSATETIKQGSTRRGANMGVLKVGHPDVEEFIDCKKDGVSFTNFNLSVAATDKFMQAVEKDTDFDLVSPNDGKVLQTLKAKKLFDKIVSNAWSNGDPGILYIDEANKYNPVPHLGSYEATNPCGEQWLLPFGVCNLGHVNLARFVKDGKIDWNRLKEVIHWGARFLDNLIDMNKYPLPQIDEMAKKTRRLGLGIMGWADMLIQLNIPYNSDEALKLAEQVMKFIHEESLNASEELAKTRGVFPAWKGSKWETEWKRKVRNAAVNTVAPTGSTGMMADCSGGIEPIFALGYIKQCMDDDKLLYIDKYFEKAVKEKGLYSKELMDKVASEGSIQKMTEIPEDIRKLFVVSHDIAPEWHIKMQAAFQKHNDSSISKTINFPNSATKEDIAKAYVLAWKLKCKGITIYRDGSRETQVLNLKKDMDKKEHAVAVTAANVILPRPRGQSTTGATFKIGTGCGNLYVTVNEDEVGLCEIFSGMGKAGGCAMAQAEGIARLASLALRAGVEVESILQSIRGIRCPNPLWTPDGMVLSCPDAVAKAVEKHLRIQQDKTVSEVQTLSSFVNPSGNGNPGLAAPPTPGGITRQPLGKKNVVGVCPECSGPLHQESGCAMCHVCGYSKCG